MERRDLIVPEVVLIDRSLRPAARLVLARLGELGGPGRLVFESAADLGRSVGLRERAASNALAELEAAGRIVREVTHSGPGHPRGWRVLVGGVLGAAQPAEAPAEPKPDPPPRKGEQLILFDNPRASERARP